MSSYPSAATSWAKVRSRADGAPAHAECMAAARLLPHGLGGPVDLALARPADTVPEHTACPGGCRYELKFDGFRVAVVRTANGARLWSRRGTDLTFAFPDLAAAAEFHLRSGTVLDGEAVVWVDGRLSFDHLQQRLARRASRAGPGGTAGQLRRLRRARTGWPGSTWPHLHRPACSPRTPLGRLGAAVGDLPQHGGPRRGDGAGARTTGRPASRAWSSSRPLAATRPAGATGSR